MQCNYYYDADLCADFDDSRLVVLVRAGDANAFLELVSRYMPVIQHYAAGMRSVLLEKEDLYQEGMLGLLHAAQSYDENRKTGFQTYAGVCIRNRLVTVWRQSANYKNLPMSNFLSLNEEEGMQVPAMDTSVDPQQMVAENEEFVSLRKHITQTLSKMEQQVFFLYLSGMGFDDIARRLHTEKKSVYNALQRARDKLRQSFSSSICPGSLH